MKRLTHLFFAALLVFCLTGQVMATTENTAIEQRFIDITRNLRCLTCDGQNIHESNSEFASRIKQDVMEKIQQGQNDENIYNDLKHRYGDAIHMTPPHTGGHIMLWILPFVFACATLVGLYAFYWKGNSARHEL